MSEASVATPQRSAIALAIAVLWLGVFVACERREDGATTHQDAVAEQARVILNDGDRVVWLGDSITHHALFTQYLETFFVTRYPGFDLEFANRGIAGDRAGDVLARYADDAVARSANVALVQLGMNDGGFRRYRDEIGATFERDIAALLDGIAAGGGTAVLVSPTVYDVEAEWRDQKRDGEPVGYDDPALLGYDAVMERFRALTRRLAADRELPFADVREPLLREMLEGRKHDPSFSIVPDSLHPSPAGHALMAVTILNEAFAQAPPVSVVEIDIDAGNASPVVAQNAAVEIDLISFGMEDSWAVSFRLLAKSLPWIVPAEAEDGFEAAGGRALNREMLTVKGLTAGSYVFSIDDFVVGTYSAEQLAAGIDVGRIADSPQRVQAKAVAELNRQRSAGPVRSIQDWRVDRKNRRAAIELAADEDEKAGLQMEFDEWLPMFELAMVDLEADAAELWQKMRKQAQPVERVYKLRSLAFGHLSGGAKLKLPEP